MSDCKTTGASVWSASGCVCASISLSLWVRLSHCLVAVLSHCLCPTCHDLCNTYWLTGHGKGPWDGFGGTLKRMCRQNAVFESVVFKSVTDVARHIRDMFCSSDWAEKHGLDPKFTINQVVVFEAALGEITRCCSRKKVLAPN